MTWMTLNVDFAVAPQIAVIDLASIAEAGFRSIVCNRPDQEDPGQPDFAQIAQAAQALGLQAHHLPVPSGQVGVAHGQALAQLLQAVPGPVLAYCRSGARCSAMWQLAQAALRGD